MAEFLIAGKVTLDSGPASAGAKQIGTAMEQMAKSGIAGFEAAQQRVFDLTKQIGGLRNELLKTNDPAAQAKLNAALSQSQKELRAAKTEMRGMTLESREASEKIQLLAAQFGVHLPQGLDRLIARLPAVQMGLEKAFSAAIIFAFTRAIAEAITNWEKFQEGLGKALGPISELEVKIANVFGLLRDYSTEARNASEASKKLTEAQEALAGRVLQAQLDFNAAGKPGIDQMVAQSNARIVMLQREQAKADQSFRAQYDVLILREKETLAARVQSQVFLENAQAAKHATGEAKSLAAQQKHLAEEAERAALAFQKQSHIIQPNVGETALARMNADIAVAHAGLKDLPPAIQGILTANQAWGDSAIKAGKDQIDAAKKAQDAVEKTAQSIESFIDRVFLQARSLSDVFHQFLMQLLGSFVKWVSRMIANALLGMKQVQGQGAGGLGGIVGSILGGIFGVGSAGVSPALAAGTAALPGAGGGATGIEVAFTGPLSAGAIGPVISPSGQVISGSGGIPTAVGGATTGLSGLAQQWASMGPLGKMLVGAGVLGGTTLVGQGFGQGSILKGALGGAALGASSALMAGLLFTPYGAIAAGIYAAVGALIGWIGKGRAKRKAAEAEEQYEFAANDLYDQYKKWKIDYDTALTGMQQLIASGREDLLHRGLGGAGQAGANNLTMVIQNEIKALDELKKKREASAQFMAGMTLPEFALGGQVPGIGFQVPGAGVLAIVHPGEFVMRREAVDALGTSFLGALNRAPRFDMGGMAGMPGSLPVGGRSVYNQTFHFHQLPGESMRAFANKVIVAIRNAEMDGAL